MGAPTTTSRTTSLVDEVGHDRGVHAERLVDVRAREGSGEEPRHRGDGVAGGQLQETSSRPPRRWRVSSTSPTA
ncbi:hypothetical protein [Clavibacter tessellarius]|uniref:hypothetical protein n=1 Tax=Clavibacter tessellarius TaxID=31965 RepID=UPI00324D7C3A